MSEEELDIYRMAGSPLIPFYCNVPVLDSKWSSPGILDLKIDGEIVSANVNINPFMASMCIGDSQCRLYFFDWTGFPADFEDISRYNTYLSMVVWFRPVYQPTRATRVWGNAEDW